MSNPREFLTLALLALLTGGAPAHAQFVHDNAVAIEAAAATPGLALTWQTTAYQNLMTRQDLHRRRGGRGPWQALASPMAIPAVSFTDPDVAPGEQYEYRITRWFSDLPHYSFGYLMAGTDVVLPRFRGRIVLVVESSLAGPLSAELGTMISDYRGDGWEVTRLDVAASVPAPDARALVAAAHAADPENTNTLVLVGNIAVPYSGRLAADGHDTHLGAWPADGYLADTNGIWTDADPAISVSSNPANWNQPGDGKWDQSWFDGDRLPEMTWGRIDFSNLPGAAFNEVELTRRYLNRLHAWKHRIAPYATVPTGALIDDHFGFFWGESFAGHVWRGFMAITGNSGCAEGDWLTDLQTNPRLLAYGCGPGDFQSAGGVLNSSQAYSTPVRAVFQFLFGSGFGDWDTTDNLLRASLAGPDGSIGLASAWAGVPQWQLHLLGGGATLGDCLRVAATDRGDPAEGYQSGQHARGTHLALMGDPTLRLYPQPPPIGLTATPGAGVVTLVWTAPATSEITGYWIDRAIGATGSFLSLNRAPVTDTRFVDTGLSPGASATYRVRAIARIHHPGGTLLVPGQGAMASATLVSGSHAPRLVITSGEETALSGDAPPKSGSEFFLDGSSLLRLTLSNHGNQPLQLTAPPLLTGPAAASYAISSPPPSAIAPQSTEDMEITFDPGGTAPSNAVLELTSNDPLDPVKRVALAGAVAPVNPVLFPALPTLTLPANGQGTLQVLVENPGLVPMDFMIESPFHRARIVSSSETGGPSHEWVDIRGAGQLLVFSDPDEDLSDPIPLGFSYPWNGGNTNQVQVCTNGYLLLSGNYPITRLAPRFPNPASPAAVVGGFWMDLVVANGGTVHALSTPSEFVVQFTNIPAYFDPERTVTFQISLYPDGCVRWRYQTIGIPTAEAVMGWQAGFNGISLPDAPVAGRSYELRQPGFGAWAIISPVSGTIAPDGHAVLQFACDTTGITSGYHREIFPVCWSGAALTDARSVGIPITLAVGPGASTATAWWANATNSPQVFPPWRADIDGDGFQNGMEYALGTHPLDRLSRPFLRMDGNAFAFRRVAGLADLDLYVESSGNLRHPWATAAASLGGGVMTPDNSPVLQDSGPGPARDTRIGAPPAPAFFRLRAPMPP